MGIQELPPDAVQRLALLLRIKEVKDSNLAPDIGYPDTLCGFLHHPPMQKPAQYLKIAHDRFLSFSQYVIVVLCPIQHCTARRVEKDLGKINISRI
jgi:hypothetical protein